MYKMDLVLNNQLWLMRHKTKQNKTKLLISLSYVRLVQDQK